MGYSPLTELTAVDVAREISDENQIKAEDEHFSDTHS